MLRPSGYVTITSPDATVAHLDRFKGKTFRCEQLRSGVTEMDTFVCGHCNGHIHVKPLAPMDEFGSMCRNCMKMTCPTCANGPCVPFEKKLDEAEKREIALRSYGL